MLNFICLVDIQVEKTRVWIKGRVWESWAWDGLKSHLITKWVRVDPEERRTKEWALEHSNVSEERERPAMETEKKGLAKQEKKSGGYVVQETKDEGEKNRQMKLVN